MNQTASTATHSHETARCPYCHAETAVELPANYKPVFVSCGLCTKKFIAERRAQGFTVMTVEEAPCFSNPDCREIEMGAGDEE
jgi:hypothetical protein